MKNLISLLLSLFFIVSAFAQKVDPIFFEEAQLFFSTNVNDGLIDYKKVKNDKRLKNLITTIETADLSSLDSDSKKAFLINAYNLQVIQKVMEMYPTESVQSRTGFFDKDRIQVGGKKYTLTSFEKQELLDEYQDPRLHFVLVCGALGCPPITNFAYAPNQLEKQLNAQTKLALNDPNFIRVQSNRVNLSQIFKWYTTDFGNNNKAVVNFINQYRDNAIDPNIKLTYYEYDWTLNDRSQSKNKLSEVAKTKKNNANRYIVSSTIPQGSIEIKVFNNLYSQRTTAGPTEDALIDRSTFFTTTTSVLYGLSNRFNLGINLKYRRVRNEKLPSEALKVFSSGEDSNFRQGITGIGPQIRYAPTAALPNFSIQSSFVFPIGDQLEGGNGRPFIDWNGAIWTTQFFNDLSVGDNFSFFTELDLIIEDIGKSEDGFLNRVSTPVTLIFSYNPNPKTTIYALSGYSPFWQSTHDYFAQAGLGAKYQFTRNVELELLYTRFTTKFFKNNGGKAATFNLGFRYNL